MRSHRLQAISVNYRTVWIVLSISLALAWLAPARRRRKARLGCARALTSTIKCGRSCPAIVSNATGRTTRVARRNSGWTCEEAAKPPAGSGERPIVPGKPDESELVRRIFAEDPDELMPPAAANSPLSDPERQTLKQWVAEGAKYDVHWAFRKPVKPSRPERPQPELGAQPDRRVCAGPA